ncbi:MAG: molybdopterin-dependent oxidoreductase [Oleiphilaceae bacterium]|nr:molybdopterin-dependent oxidoreductase [Oleiphilaceae bacterium]
MPDTQTHFRACHLCEAICGVEIKTQGNEIISIKGDPLDPFSRGHICPKATALKDLHEDSDRLRSPVKKVNGKWQPIAWQQAIEDIATAVAKLQQRFGNDTVGVYAGNPNVHNYGNLTHGRQLRKALATRNNFSATSLDQLPHQLVAYLMYGHQFLIPVPDIDETEFMLILGANPLASNGSMMTVPDVKKRLKQIQQRGGRFVVIDPRRTETADIADAHHFIRPGSDAFLLFAMIHTLFDEGLVDLGGLDDFVADLEQLESLFAPFTPELAEAKTQIDAATIRGLARELANTPKAVVYGRMGVSVQQFGTLCQWAIQLLNLLTGHLDNVGGALVPASAVAYVKPGEPGAGHFAKYHSRVSGLPEFSGEFPASVMAEEMLTEGEGQIRAMITLAGNPVLSAPNGRRLDEAFNGLDLMVSLDFYINETTRHADYILPPTGPLEHDHYDIAFHRLAVRNTTRFNEPVFEPAEGSLHDWEILNALGAAIAEAKGFEIKPLPTPDMLMDFALQSGPYGKAAGSDHALSLAKLKAHPHGIDLGPLRPSLTERLCTEDKKIHALHDLFVNDIARLKASIKQETPSFQLIGRRHVRSNNSWMHNYYRLIKGKARSQCLMHPKDMQTLGIEDGQTVRVRSRVGEVETAVQGSEEIMPGVVSIPHGWGHQRDGVRLNIASQQVGVSVNDLTDDEYFDQATGNAALNGVPVEIIPLAQA